MLECLLDGDAMSAVIEKRRFTTIDNQLNRVAEIIGDGRIDGWEILPQSFPDVIVTEGRGFIDRFYVNTFGDIKLELSENGVFYIYAQRKSGIIGAEGPRSDINFIEYVDGGAPNIVTGLNISVGDQVVGSPYVFDVDITWNSNSEPDISHYEIERTIASETETLISETNSYTDQVDEDSDITYTIYAVDQSGNRSTPVSEIVSTPLSLTLPQNPISIEIKTSEAGINLLWKRPEATPFSIIDHWLITWVRLDSNGEEIGSTLDSRIVNKNNFTSRIDELTNGELYRISIFTVDNKNRFSTGYTTSASPQPSAAPRDPEGISYSESSIADNAIEVSLSWVDGDTPYDPATTFRYKIYVTMDGQAESLSIDVPIGFTEEQVSLYTFDLVEYFPIPENTLITFRITALDQSGFESFGNYVRFITSTFRQPIRLRNLTSEFNQDNRTITARWDTNPDTSDIRVVVDRENITDEYVFSETISDEVIEKTGIYIIEDVSLDMKYTISVTPINSVGTSGPTSVTVELTIIPGGLPLPSPPTSIEVKTGDKQLTLTWDQSSTIYTNGYKVYKKSGDITFDFDEWELIDALPVSVMSFSDYGLTNDTVYSYYITATDIYGRESLHLSTGALNVNYSQGVPRREGILTEPTGLEVFLVGSNITLTWESLSEEFNGFTIYRSTNNLHSWEELATVDRNTLIYTDQSLPLVDGTIFYYNVAKTIDDAQIIAQTTSSAPENSLLLGIVTTSSADVATFSIDVSGRRDIKDMIDPLTEITQQLILSHKHRDILPSDPDRIDLNSELVVTDWSTVDGRIFFTSEQDISGTNFILKVNDRFPSVFYTIDTLQRRIIFSEAIVEFDAESGVIIGDIPQIELRVLGIEEVQGTLENSRFDNIHARQVQFGNINNNQLPPIGHDGRIREPLLPDRYLLERYNNHTFIVQQGNTNSSKNFGDGTTFYAIAASDGKIEEIIDWDQQNDGALVGFRKPSFSSTTVLNLKQNTSSSSIATGNDNSTGEFDDLGTNISWSVNPAQLTIGRVSGNLNDSYLIFPLDIPPKSTVSECNLVFTAIDAGAGMPNIEISALDPESYTESTDLQFSSISLVDTIGSISWQPGIWDAGTVSNLSTVNVTSLVQLFVNENDYIQGNRIIFRVKSLPSTNDGSYRSAFSQQSVSNSPILETSYVIDTAEVSSDPEGFQSEKCYKFQFEFNDLNPYRWVRISTFDTPIKPNPIINLKKRLRFRILLQTGSLYLSVGIREISGSNHTVGGNGGTTGSVEWIGVNSTSDGDQIAPIGTKITGNNEWQEIDIDIQKSPVVQFPYEDSDGILQKTGFGVLDHLAFTVDPESESTGPFTVLIDKLEQVSDVLVSGTSQGILLSDDFGSNWELSRLTETPVHRFFRAESNEFLWAISANEVLIATDPAFWFVLQGTDGVEFIRDICEDSSGNIFVSTDKGVLFFEIALIRNFSSFRQTQPINAFTTDTYALYHNSISSGMEEIWASTEIGIFKTSDSGTTWEDTGLETSGLVAFQFVNIGTDISPAIIASTRKHILRKLSTDNQFYVVCNFEQEFGITKIWEISYFSGKIFVTTENGVYTNTTDILFTPGISGIPFDKTLDNFTQNNYQKMVFSIDTVDLGEDGEKMFVGLENELFQVNSDLTVSLKKQYPNRELPSFYVNSTEVVSGYIYNAFNKTLCFREPILVNSIVSSELLPRRSFFAKNGGWGQTNPGAEFFIYKNGFPLWLDFAYDENSILGEAQILDGKLRTIDDLTSFNSLIPDSNEYLSKTIDAITQIRTGNTDDSPLINNSTIIEFLSSYIRFLSLITEKVANNYDLTITPIHRIGINRSQREPGSKANVIEEKDGFTADDSTGIVVDVVAGEVDFTAAFANATSPEDRVKFSFNKFDDLQITIFNTNVANTGDLTHTEIEDRMEDINTGLTSDLARTHYTNLIKMGIFMERQHNYLFDRFSVSRIQSNFFAAHTNEWYDIPNSTVDYDIIDGNTGNVQSRFVNNTLVIDDPYLPDTAWIGTDNGIVEFSMSDHVVEIQRTIRPGGFSNLFIWDICLDNSIYVTTSDPDGNYVIYVTGDYGATWDIEPTANLPEQFFSFRIINGTKFVNTADGPFYSDNTDGGWFPCSVVLSDNLAADSPAKTAFTQKIFNVNKTTFMILESNGWFYTSGTGIEFFALAGQMTLNSVSAINCIIRHKNITWIGTDKGLYSDSNSILSDSVQWGLQTELEDGITASKSVIVNDLISDGLALYACSSNGKIYRFYDIDINDDTDMEWKSYYVPNFGPIHKIIFMETNKKYIVAISYNQIRVIDVSYETGVFDVE